MDRIKEIEGILEKHRKDMMITCAEDCPCWQIETLLTALATEREERDKWKKKYHDLNDYVDACLV